MSLYKVPFDFTHEEKVFRWLFIIKTNVIYDFKCYISWNIILKDISNYKNNNVFKCCINIFNICFLENRKYICRQILFQYSKVYI